MNSVSTSNDEYVLFDVGANRGTDSIERTRANKNYIAHAFEPTPILYEKLCQATGDIKDRYHINKVAVSDFVGNAIFNIAGQADWGCSSLNTFSDNLDKTWPGRTDFKVTEKIQVNVITLESYIIKNNISKIDYLHCDTQGSDLKVLKGLGQYLNIVKCGVIEVPNSEQVKLYKENHTFEEAKIFLENNGFKIYGILDQMNEKNVYFSKR
jgi:FkbM family methyltransferase